MNVWICVVWEIKIDNVGNKLKVDASGNPGLLIFVPLAALLVLVNFLGLARFDVIPQFWVSFFQKLFVWGHDDLVEAAIELTDNVAPGNKIVFVFFLSVCVCVCVCVCVSVIFLCVRLFLTCQIQYSGDMITRLVR